MINFTDSTFRFKTWHLTIYFIGIYIVIAYATNVLIFTDSYYFLVLGSQLSNDKIARMIEFKSNYVLASYCLIPLIVVLKFILVSLLIYAACFFFDVVLTFANCLKIILLAELMPIIASVVKTMYLLFYPPETIGDVQFFFPLSILQLLDVEKMPSYLIYPLQLINLFEVGYWIILVFGVSYFLKTNAKKSFVLVSASYGLGLFIWALVVLFIQLQFS